MKADPQQSPVSPASGRRLVIASNLDPAQNARLAAHPSQPKVLTYTDSNPPWDVPPEAELLFTFARSWSEAPRTAPPGWPFNLRWMQVAAAGVDAFPEWALRGLPVTCGRGVAARNIAEYVATAILVAEKRFDRPTLAGKGDWVQQPLGSLAGRTVGLLGLGAIGQAVTQRLAPFGPHVIATRRAVSEGREGIVELLDSVEAVLARSHHVVLALPLTDRTRHILNARSLAAAKPGLHVVNVSRGGLVDQAALLDALQSRRLSRATLDVTDPEPLPDGHPLYRHPRVYLTPHVSWMSSDYEELLSRKLLGSLDAYLAGRELPDRVDADRQY